MANKSRRVTRRQSGPLKRVISCAPLAATATTPLILSRRKGTGNAAAAAKFPQFVSALRRKRFKPVLYPALELQAVTLGLSADRLTGTADMDTFGDSFVTAAEVLVKDGVVT